MMRLSLALCAIAGAAAFRAPAARRPALTASRMAAAAAEDCASVVVGAGRIGSLLAENSGGLDVVVGREDEIPADGTGPIYVCTRNDVLDAVVDKCPEGRREDLVFLQNGYIDSWLKSRGLESNTQALLFFAVTKKGADPIDGVTTVNPEGLTTVTGKWSNALVERLGKAGLKCNGADAALYQLKMFEKLMWISGYMLMGAAKGCETVGEVKERFSEDMDALVSEMTAAVEARYGITFEAGVSERLAAYTDVVATFPCAVKEFEWRNGFFWAISRQLVKDAAGDEAKDALPLHTSLLRSCADQGLLGFDLPSEPDEFVLLGKK